MERSVLDFGDMMANLGTGPFPAVEQASSWLGWLFVGSLALYLFYVSTYALER
ncbi:MAG: hypothetical protein S4CHLAM102_05360 [Chlamydiia bacterium]|nr:hypothetical protein [Chlamydiia bacterium]